MYLGSDAIALAPFTDSINYLENGDWVVLKREGAEVRDSADQTVQRPALKSSRRRQKASIPTWLLCESDKPQLCGCGFFLAPQCLSARWTATPRAARYPGR
jgi:hypothetical protein